MAVLSNKDLVIHAPRRKASAPAAFQQILLQCLLDESKLT